MGKEMSYIAVTGLKTTDLIEMLIQLRQEAKAQKNYALSDQIRIQLSEIGIELKDSKEGTHFTIH